MAKGGPNDMFALAARMRIREWEEHPERYQPGYVYEPPEDECGAIVIASGDQTRFQLSKLLAPRGRSTVLGSVVRSLSTIGIRPIYVIAGEDHAAVSEVLKRTHARVLHNPDSSSGVASSLRTGAMPLPSLLNRFLVTYADQPEATPTHLVNLAAALIETRKGISIATHNGQRGTPVCFCMKYRCDIAALTDQQSLSDMVDAHPDDVTEVQVPFECRGF
jgi:CTP:molybdopterin cytidylyltransferase MocA